MPKNNNADTRKEKRALLVGHLSTVGDVEVLRQVERQLQMLGVDYDVSPYTDGPMAVDPTWLDRFLLDPARYTHLIVICGPFTPAMAAKYDSIFARFGHCVHIGVNLTMVESLALWNPFEVLLERDSDRTVRPDLSFRETPARVPVVGLCLVESQSEYGARQRSDLAGQKLRRLIARSGVAFVEMDTSVPVRSNKFGLTNAAQFESICSRMDVMLTSRLHGTVLALKNGVPTISVDPVAGGDKVTRQARELGWTEVFDADLASDADLDAALARCLSDTGKAQAALVRDKAIAALADFDLDFAAALQVPAQPSLRENFIPRIPAMRKLRKRYRAWRRGTADF